MKKIAIAALLAALGSGAALAQGAPPGSPSWHSGWPSSADLLQAQAMNARKLATTRSDQLAASRTVPVAANPQRNARGS